MHVLLVTHYYPAHRGGIELVAAELARRLAAEHGATITWYASDCDPPPAIVGVAPAPASACNAIERRFGMPFPLWSPAALLELARAARAADVVHLHDCLYLPNVVAYLAARLAGRPVVVTQHIGMVPYRNPALRALLAAAYGILGRLVLGGATRVVFVSETVRRYFASFVRFRATPEVVPNGVDPSVFHPVNDVQRAALRAAWGVLPGKPLLLFVGRFVEKKGLPVLRLLADRMRDARWLFAGWGPLDPERWGFPNVVVARERSGATLASLYQAADLLVLPSAGEGFPLVVQEAMACGTPALVGADTATACAGAEKVLFGEAIEGTEAVARWEQRIRALTSDAAPAATLRAAVAAHAVQNWSWERCATRYAALLESAAARA